MKSATLVATPPPSIQATVSVRRIRGDVVELDTASATADVLAAALPWRTFRWYYGQKHYSGIYWSVTEGGHVIYESRLELARLLFADFDPDVRRIVAQPFLLRAFVAERRRICRHVADYLLVTSTGIRVVAVKPAFQLADPKVTATFAWVRDVVESAGWSFEIFTEPDPVLLSNVRFIAGYRRQPAISPAVLASLRALTLTGMTIGEAMKVIDAPAPRIRAALMHMLWSHELRADLTKPLASHTILNGGHS